MSLDDYQLLIQVNSVENSHIRLTLVFFGISPCIFRLRNGQKDQELHLYSKVCRRFVTWLMGREGVYCCECVAH